MGAIRTAIQITDGFSPAFKSMNNALGVVMSSLASTQKALGKPIDLTAITRAQTDLARAASQFDQIEKEAIQASKGQNQLNQSMKEGQSAASGLIGKLKGLLGVYAGFEGLKTLIGGADVFTNINSRLDLMNDGLQTTAELSAKVWESANRTYSSFQATADAVGKFGIQAAEAFSNAQDVVNFSEQINKHLAIAGTQGAAAEGAMIQLVQAMSNGVLRGEELNSVMDGMPTVVKAIREEFARMGDTRGIKEIAEEGLISAEIVKRALYNAADDTNKKFSEMGATFGQVWTLFRNYADKALIPVYKRLGEISNSQGFQNLAKAAGSAFAALGWAIMAVLNIASKIAGVFGAVFNFIRENSSWTVPILMSVAAAFAAQGAAALWAKREIVLNAAMVAWKAACDWAATAAILAMEFAQNGFNAALAMCPLSWIIGLVIALVGVFYLGVAAVNALAGTTLSATGLIGGAIAWLGALIWNLVASVWNSVAALLDAIVNPVIGVMEIVYNAFNGGFSGWIGGVKTIFFTFVNWLYKTIKPLIQLWDQFKGTNYAATIQASIDNQIDSGKSDNYKTFERDNFTKKGSLGYLDLGDSFDAGYAFGETLSEKFNPSNLLSNLGGSTDAAENWNSAALLANASKTPATGYGNALSQIAKNTGKTAANTETLTATEEELKYLREVGEREAINRFTTAEIKVDMTNNNTVSSGFDLDKMIDAFTVKLRNAIGSAAEGAHI